MYATTAAAPGKFMTDSRSSDVWVRFCHCRRLRRCRRRPRLPHRQPPPRPQTCGASSRRVGGGARARAGAGNPEPGGQPQAHASTQAHDATGAGPLVSPASSPAPSGAAEPSWTPADCARGLRNVPSGGHAWGGANGGPLCISSCPVSVIFILVGQRKAKALGLRPCFRK